MSKFDSSRRLSLAMLVFGWVAGSDGTRACCRVGAGDGTRCWSVGGLVMCGLVDFIQWVLLGSDVCRVWFEIVCRILVSYRTMG